MKQTQKTKDKVSMRQLAMIYIIIGFSPAIRFLPAFTAKIAKEAAWVSPVVAIIPIGFAVFLFHNIFKNTKEKSTFEVITDIFGKYAGNFTISIFLIWTVLLLGFYIRLNGERLTSTLFPNISITLFIALTLIAISYVLRSGATAIARMGEFLTPVLLLLYTFIAVFLLPKVRTDAMLPVYFNDTISIIKASIGTASLFSLAIIVFMFSPKIFGKENTAKIMIKAGFVYFTMIIVLLIMSIGVLGSSITARSSNPFLIIVKQISILDTIENIESLVIAMWLLSDSMLIATIALVSLNIMSYLFKLSDQRNMINIFFVFIYIFSLTFASNRYEVDLFANKVIIFINTSLGYGTPALLYIVGKIRKKI